MQRNFSAFMIDSNNSTPQEKLRKISFDQSQLTNYLDTFHKHQGEIVDGWGSKNWDMNKTGFNSQQNQQKSHSVRDSAKNTSPRKKAIFSSKFSTDRSSQRSKYIQKLQQKLVQLVQIKIKEQQSKQTLQQRNPQDEKTYLTPRKYLTTGIHTTSTSQSECQYNFTKKDKSPLFKIKKHMQQKQRLTLATFSRFQESKITSISPIRSRTNTKSMLTSYQPISQRSRQVPLVSYPVIDQKRKPRQSKFQKLNDFVQSFYLNRENQTKNSCQRNVLRQDMRNGHVEKKRENSFFKIRITEPKTEPKQKKNEKLVCIN